MGEYIVLTFAVIGLYAVFARVIALLMPKGCIRIALALSGKESREEMRALLLAARLRAEREKENQNEIVVLLEGDPDESTVRFLRLENISVYNAMGEKGG